MAKDVDLRIIKTIDDYTPQVGQEVTWTVQIVNDGTDFADNVSVTDLVPEGMSFVSSSVDGGNIDAANGVWSLGGGLAGGETTTATITMVVTEDDGSLITNNATVHTDSHDCNPYNDNSPIAVNPWTPIHADLAVVKTVSDSTPSVGDTIEWTVNVTNNGPDTAWGTMVSDTLPEGVTFLGARASSGHYDFATGNWSVGGLEDGATAEIVITTRVDTDAAATFVNTAVATSHSYDSNEQNNTAQAEIHVSDNNDNGMGDTGNDGGTSNDSDGGSGNGGGSSHGGGHGGSSHGGMGSSCYSAAFCCACDIKPEAGADLQIIKLVSDPTPGLNDEVVWSLVVTNNGPEDAVNVIVNDNLPAGVEYVSDSATLGEFSESAGVWEIGDLANGESALLQITTIATDPTTAQTNIALVSSDTEDSNPANDVATATIDVDVNLVDLAITKTVDNMTPQLGEEVTWRLEVVNNGPDDAENVIITDVIPEGTTFVSSSNANYDPVSGTLMQNLAAGQSDVILITVTVDDADGPRLNTASITSDGVDTNPDNNVAEAQTDAVAADLAIEKTVDNETPNLGESVTWTIVVTNNGPDTAENVIVSDALPAGTTLVESSDDRFDADTGMIALGDLASEESVSFELLVTVDDADGAQVNTASVESDTFDNDTSNNSDDAAVDAIAADLEIDKTVDNPAPNLGDEVVWTITVINNGPDAAENVIVNDALPPGTSFVSADSEDFDEESESIALGTLASGETVTIEVTVTVDDADGARTNIATVTSDTFDDNTDNNSAQAVTDAVAADLEIDKSVNDATPNLGDEVIWTITVTNNGPDTAEAVVVSDVLPEGTTFVESTADFDSVAGIVELGDLDSGQSVSFDITVTVDDREEIDNTATVSSDTFDNDDTNNSDNAIVDAVVADVTISKVPDDPAPNLGENATWNITVTNDGPDVAENVVVTDILPEGTTFVESTLEGFDPSTGMVALGDLEPDALVSFDITVTVNDASPQNNVVSVASDTFDDDESNNTSESVVDAVITDLVIDKEVDNPTPDVGAQVVFTTTVTNEGPDLAENVNVIDNLPEGVTFVSADVDFDPAIGSVDLGNLEPGDSASFAITVTVDEADMELVNTADVTNDTVESDLDNNSAEASVTAVVPNPVPDAVNDAVQVTSIPGALNAVIMVDHSGSTGTDSAGPDEFLPGSGFGNDLFDQDGNLTSRLQIIRDAVADFAEREAIASIKVLGFDSTAGGPGNVSPWFDLTGSDTAPDDLVSFLADFEASGTTNYADALEASQDFFVFDADGNPDPVPNGGEVNYYFLTDGVPQVLVNGALDPIVGRPTEAQVVEWQAFVEENFNNSYGIGYGAGAGDPDFDPDNPFSALDLVSHIDDPAITGVLDLPTGPVDHDEENTLVVSEADAIPAELFSTISESVSGNVFENDEIGDDGNALGGEAIASIEIDGVIYTYDGNSITSGSGSFVDTAFVRDDFFNTPLDSGGRFEFNFANGDYEYFTPLAEVEIDEVFEYTITDGASPDGAGDSDSATLTITVLPGDPAAPSSEPLAVDDGELFTSGAMTEVQTVSDTADSEWAVDGDLFAAELYDSITIV